MESTTAINYDDEEKWEAEEEEEALSLCDLPINLIKEENQIQPRNEEDGESHEIKTEEDFNFGSWGGSLSTTEPEMCAADEVFFKGQILPLCLSGSVSSDSGLTGCRHQDIQTNNRCLSRSESMDHGSLSRFTSVSSSSTRSSHFSINSSNSSTVTARNFNSITNSKSKAIKTRNNFNTHPSPKPQIRLSKTRPVINVSSRNQKSSMWEFFRLGLVRAPELELQDLKVRSNYNNNANRNSVSRNSSCNSSSNNSGSNTKNNSTSKIVNNNSGDQVAKNQQDSNKGLLEKRIGLFSGCKCSVNAVETVPLNNIVVIKSIKKNSEKEKAMPWKRKRSYCKN